MAMLGGVIPVERARDVDLLEKSLVPTTGTTTEMRSSSAAVIQVL
jgi:hypothetical protein